MTPSTADRIRRLKLAVAHRKAWTDLSRRLDEYNARVGRTRKVKAA